MKPRQLPWKRLLLSLVGLCLIGIGLLPWLIGDTSTFGDRIAAKLEHWTGAEVELTGPVELRYFPRLSIDSGLTIRNPKSPTLPTELTCEHARIALSLPHLLLGRLVVQSINLIEPEITYEQPSAPGPEGWHRAEAALVKMLGKRPFHVLRTKNGTVRFVSPTSTSRIENLTLKLDLGDGSERTDGFGTFVWKGELVRFTYETGFDAETIRTASSETPSPLNVSIESAPFSATIDGAGVFDHGFAMEGTMNATIADLRDFLRWVDIADLDGSGLKDISLSGPFRLSDRTLIFEDGHYAIDGNSASGLLAIGLGGERPRVEATLAFDTLSLDPYLGPVEETVAPDDGEEETASTETAAAPPPPAEDLEPQEPVRPIFDWTMVKLADADLRFSANTIAARDLRFGGGAFTIAVQDGIVIGDIADLELCGGLASARFTLNLTAPTRDADFAARLEQVDASPCLQLFALDVPLEGRANLKGQFKTTGQSWGDFLHQVSGSIELDANNGSLPVDVGSLMSEDVPIEKVGWAPAPATSFGSLNASCRIAAAQIWCQRFSMETPQGPVSGSGKIDFASSSLDWDVMLPIALTSTNEPPAPQPLRKVTLRGPIDAPVISRDGTAPSATLPATSQPITPN
ncbi:AsmA-like C-terminal region-containing protein [Methyloligella solikamskensis]|uniref:AsmA-like C-terminal region-containing protein n=1 Tax=Methyloligella solikamskensis TaxID=1177756 RepID=A0ABW3JEP7_9HYPH